MNSRVTGVRTGLLALGVAALTLTACSSTGSSGSTNEGTTTADSLKGSVTVLAAASLTETFDGLKKSFESAHKGVTVTISYAGSDALAAQINSGAPADVFAAASEKTMKIVTDAGNAAGMPMIFAANSLAIAVPTSNPAKITTLADVTKPGVKLAVCAATVPCGAAAVTVFKSAGLALSPVTQEQDVKGVLTKVQLNEVDAGLVYLTDVKSAGSKVKGITFPESSSALTKYPITVVKNAPNGAVAQAFVAFVLGADGQKALADAGFAKP